MIEEIKQIIQCRYWYEFNANENITLKDINSGMEVDISNVPANGIVINIDAAKNHGSFHLGALVALRGLKQSCDKLILTHRAGKIEAYFIELKKTYVHNSTENNSKPCNQILHTILAFHYLTSIVKYHFQVSSRVNMYFAIIAKKLSNKLDIQSVKQKLPENHEYESHKFKTIYSTANIPFTKLK